MDKPAFNPNAPFQVVPDSSDSTNKPAFNPQAPFQSSDEGSNLQDFGHGVINPLGVAPVVGGAAEAAIDKLKEYINSDEGQTFLTHYRKHQQDLQGQFDEAKKRSPYLYGAGQLTGAVGGSALASALGLLGGGATLGAAAEQGMAPLLGELGTRAAGGAALGAISGAAESKGNADTEEGQQQMLNDAIDAGKTGAIAAPVIGAAAEGIGAGTKYLTKGVMSKLNELAEDNPNLRRLLLSFEQGTEGKGFKGQAAEQSSTDAINNSAKDIGKDLSNARQKLASNVGEAVSNTPDISSQEVLPTANEDLAQLPDISNDSELANTRDYQRLSGLIDRFDENAGETIDPEQLFNFRKDLVDLQANSEEPVIKKQISDYISNIDDKLSNNPDYAEAMQNLRTVPSQTAELFTGKPLNQFGSQDEAQQALTNGLKSNIRKIGGYGARDSDIEARDTFNQLKNNLTDLQRAQPDLFQALGLDGIHNKLKNAQNVSDLEEIRQLINKKVPSGSIVDHLFSTLFLPLKATGLGGSGVYGTTLQVANRTGYAASKIGQLGKTLYNAPTDVLKQAADVLDQAGLSTLAQGIHRGIEDSNPMLTNTAIFSIMQNPKARALLGMSNVDNTK